MSAPKPKMNVTNTVFESLRKLKRTHLQALLLKTALKFDYTQHTYVQHVCYWADWKRRHTIELYISFLKNADHESFAAGVQLLLSFIFKNQSSAKVAYPLKHLPYMFAELQCSRKDISH